MASRPEFPAQALLVLAALCEQPTTRWQDGCALAMQTERVSADVLGWTELLAS